MGMYQVPLVSYEEGKRIVVGEAIVKDDGKIEARIDPDDRGSKLVAMLRNSVGEFSIGPER